MGGEPAEGPQVRAWRRHAGLTQAELARRAGVHRNSINRVERGLASPRAALLAAVARALGIPPARLWERPPAGPPAPDSSDPAE